MMVLDRNTEEMPLRNADHPSESLQELQHHIDHAAHWLPSQGPIEVFVHHNTLHAFEQHPFHEAVKLGLKTFSAQPYFSERRYREMLDTGRLRVADLTTVLRETLADQADEKIGSLGTKFDLRLAMLLHPQRTGLDVELHWLIAETDALRRFRLDVSAVVIQRMLETTKRFVVERDQRGLAETDPEDRTLAALLSEFGSSDNAKWNEQRWEEFVLRYLWRVCRQGVAKAEISTENHPRPVRVRDALLAATGEDADFFVHDLLIRFTSAFLDQGFAEWQLPERDRGFFQSFLTVFGQPAGPLDQWLRGLPTEIFKLVSAQATPLNSIAESLEILGVSDSKRGEFIATSLLALRGWAGMVWQLESAANWVDRPVPKDSLVEFLAVRLILDRLASEYVAREFLEFEGPLNQVAEAAWSRVEDTKDKLDQQAFLVFQIAQSLGWAPHILESLKPDEWRNIVREISAFDEVERRAMFHLAYERKYRIAALDAIAIHSQRRRALAQPARRPSFQLVCCIDDREESFRRHLEEIAPACETFGAAGFFAVVMNYQGVSDAHYKPLCPIVITPKHFVKEDVGYTFEGVHQRRAETRRTLGRVTHQVHSRSRTFLGGILTGLFGSLAAFPLVARVLFPRLTAQLRRRVGRLVQPPAVTQLQLERYLPDPGPENGHVGFTLPEMVDLVERLLRDLGLTKNFSRLIIFVGHGSSSINNPHESAYNCGACAGKRGGPNARAFAQIANDWRVRAKLIERGIVIPEDTVFIGSYHNTCDDSVIWYDLDRLPPSHRSDFEQSKSAVDEARMRNAHERCRRFGSADLGLTPAEALRHVEQRSEDLSQVRPEYNHATNALCFVGRREWSRGLFLDRRSFLTSYDPAQDDENSSILFRILAAAIPVCGGINLEYYFSCVDPVGYGSGSKLPHNIASLLGVMEGAISDLRTGLYQQMIEIHEPMRLLFVIESTPEAMLSIMARHDEIGRLCRGNWVQIAVLNAQTSELQLFHNGKFERYEPSTDELPSVPISGDWYRNRRDHLDFASIREHEPAARAS